MKMCLLVWSLTSKCCQMRSSGLQSVPDTISYWTIGAGKSCRGTQLSRLMFGLSERRGISPFLSLRGRLCCYNYPLPTFLKKRLEEAEEWKPAL